MFLRPVQLITEAQLEQTVPEHMMQKLLSVQLAAQLTECVLLPLPGALPSKGHDGHH
jgi:hypothetical protein